MIETTDDVLAYDRPHSEMELHTLSSLIGPLAEKLSSNVSPHGVVFFKIKP